MKLRHIIYTLMAGCLAIAPGCKKETANLKISLPEKFDGQHVELISYADSSVVASAVVNKGTADFTLQPGDSLQLPSLLSVVIDGRIRGFYVAEPGNAVLNDSINVAKGTPENDRFGQLLIQLDSIENTDDMDAYVTFAEKAYNDNIDNPLRDYFGIEWLKYAAPQKVDSMLQTAPDDFRNSRRALYYENFAHLRSNTAPGKPFADFSGEDANGKPVKLSQYAGKGKYVVVDFWASWCPYCIKELPDIARFYETGNGRQVEVVGVAVRDKVDDTKAAVEKYGISWPVIYNTQRVPYDLYGFTGIPHHILIGPDGTIISRGESMAQIEQRVEQLLNTQEPATTK